MRLRIAVITMLAAVALAPSAARSQDAPLAASSARPLHRIVPQTPGDLRELLKHTKAPAPFVSAHRGGARPGFPENCIATFESTLEHAYAILEIDPRYAKDGAIVVHHDPRLERTTTGKGLLTDYTFEELKKLRLKDTSGNVTDFQIPTLDEVLDWARGKTVLVLDQKDVSVEARVEKIEQHRAEAYAMLIVYSYAEAKACFALNPNIMMEVMVPNLEKVAEFDKTGVPWQNVVAFVGHVPPKDVALYEAIHAKGACCMIGTSRNLDRQFTSKQVADMKQLESGYRAFLARGADLVETDIPIHVGPLLYGSTSPPASKAAYFSVK